MSMAMRMAYFLTGGICGTVLGVFVAVILLGLAMYADEERERRRHENER